MSDVYEWDYIVLSTSKNKGLSRYDKSAKKILNHFNAE